MMLGGGSVETLARQRKAMDTKAPLTESLMLDTLMNYLVTMARTVESAMNRALDAIVSLDDPRTAALRSEEHTSELQSRLHLVCRLLLEKKKTYTPSHITRLCEYITHQQ